MKRLPHVQFRLPRREEMALRQRWLSDPAIMSFNARWNVNYPGYQRATGCIDFPRSEWDSWYGAWVDRPDRQYWLVEDIAGQLVAHAHYAVNQDEGGRRVASLGATVFTKFRRRGLGLAVFSELMQRIRARNDVDVVQNSFESSRTGAVRIHEALDFKLVGVDTSMDSERPVGIYELSLR